MNEDAEHVAVTTTHCLMLEVIVGVVVVIEVVEVVHASTTPSASHYLSYPHR